MPIEIKELVIRAKVSEQSSTTANNGAGSAADNPVLTQMEKVLQDIKEQLKRKNER